LGEAARREAHLLAISDICDTKRRGRSRLHLKTKEADMRKNRDLQNLPSFQHLA
jgi:hypothetical protein